MDSKQAPPTYTEAVGPVGTNNTGYVPPAGDQGTPPQAGGYAPPAGGYPPPPANYGQPAPGGGGYYYPPQQGGYTFQHQTAVVMNQPVRGQVAVGAVPDHMGLAIFTTICCCWPLGLVAIMRAQESRRAMERGDLTSATTYSAEARRYSMWAIAGGVLSIIIAVVIIVVIVSSNTYTYY